MTNNTVMTYALAEKAKIEENIKWSRGREDDATDRVNAYMSKPNRDDYSAEIKKQTDKVKTHRAGRKQLELELAQVELAIANMA